VRRTGLSAKRTLLFHNCASGVMQLTIAHGMPRLMATFVNPEVVPTNALAFRIKQISVSSDLKSLSARC